LAHKKSPTVIPRRAFKVQPPARLRADHVFFVVPTSIGYVNQASNPMPAKASTTTQLPIAYLLFNQAPSTCDSTCIPTKHQAPVFLTCVF